MVSYGSEMLTLPLSVRVVASQAFHPRWAPHDQVPWYLPNVYSVPRTSAVTST